MSGQSDWIEWCQDVSGVYVTTVEDAREVVGSLIESSMKVFLELTDPDAIAAREAVVQAQALREAAGEFDAIWNRGHDNSVHPDSYLLRERADRVAAGDSQ